MDHSRSTAYIENKFTLGYIPFGGQDGGDLSDIMRNDLNHLISPIAAAKNPPANAAAKKSHRQNFLTVGYSAYKINMLSYAGAPA
ncbi:MAG: hypothetical protein QM278_05510 [Pseudomonadota bacterium]|nr:hypothetical protein [Pseudomonadota bacterium]